MKPDFSWRGEEIYLDNAATTMVDPEVVDAMQPFLEERYGNPETMYGLGREANDAVEDARSAVAELLGCTSEELFFTSGGTEANNWAIKGFVAGVDGVMVGSVEHASVIEPAKWRCKNAPYFEVPVDEFGGVMLDVMEEELKKGNYGLVSIQYGNNEVGTVHDLVGVAELCRKYKVMFHCDAVQAFGKVRFDVDDVGADMVSLSAHKIHGPVGIGALYVKKGTRLEPLLHGGGHESGMRSGTLAVHQIVGFGKAVRLADESITRDMPRISQMVDAMASDMVMRVQAKRKGHPTRRLPHILSMTVPGLDVGLACGMMSSKYGICASGGAACSTRLRSSHVLEAMGMKSDAGHTIRVSMSRYTKPGDSSMFVSRLQAVVRDAARMELV